MSRVPRRSDGSELHRIGLTTFDRVSLRMRVALGRFGLYIDGMSAAASILTTIDDIRDNLAFLDDWEERYRFLIDLGRGLPPLPDNQRIDANKVRGCASQVWLIARPRDTLKGVVLDYIGDSDAHIVRGLIAVVLALFSGRTADEILATDARAIFDELGLAQHLTAQRSNGLFSMVERIKADARALKAREAQANVTP